MITARSNAPRETKRVAWWSHDRRAGSRKDSIRIEGALDPLDPILDQHHVEAARRHCAKTADVVPRREDDAASLHARDAAAGTPMRAGRALPHFDEHQRAVARI